LSTALRLIRRSAKNAQCAIIAAIDKPNTFRLKRRTHCSLSCRYWRPLPHFEVANRRNADVRGFRQIVLRNLKKCARSAALSWRHALKIAMATFYVKIIVLS
jgi:hypothetical protein